MEANRIRYRNLYCSVVDTRYFINKNISKKKNCYFIVFIDFEIRGENVEAIEF